MLIRATIDLHGNDKQSKQAAMGMRRRSKGAIR